MDIKDIKNIVIIGLGYVGLPLAILFSKEKNVIGFDTNIEKIENYKKGIDVTKEVGDDKIKESNIDFTSDPHKIAEGDFLIITVPTPIDSNNMPDLTPVREATKLVGKYMKKNAIVVYESTVYPGVTEEICKDILEKESGLTCGQDFKIGYSPERVNPGDKVHKIDNIIKIVSGIDSEALDIIENVYSIIAKAGVYRASSIKVAEAAKVIENSQRDINIAFVNEISKILKKFSLDTNEVLDAACTKWNFLNFRPGLVGGHCIGVDPYYLIEKSKENGYVPEFMLAARNLNNSMGEYIAGEIEKKLLEINNDLKNSIVLIKGITFKENVNDIRNSKIVDIISGLQKRNINITIEDPYANPEEVKREYGLEISNASTQKVDLIVFAVAHDIYRTINPEDIKKLLKNERKIIFDIKGIFNKEELEKENIEVWRL